MARSNRTPPADALASAGLSYWSVARQPLQILAFLAPLLIAYEVGLAWLLRSDAGVLTNKAHETLLRFFGVVGISPTGGLYLGGLVIVVILLTWHMLSRQRWRIDAPSLVLMAVESVLLALPLIVLGQMVNQHAAMPAAVLGATSGQDVHLAELGIWSRLAISIGAGLYEELMFRMLLIAVVHTLLVDAMKLSHRSGSAIAVVLAAAAFMLYHPLRDDSGGLLLRNGVFYFAAGLYFGVVYVLRGFGIVVGVHAAYDVLVTLFLLDWAD